MNHEDLIAEFRSDPCDNNSDAVQNWLARQPKYAPAIDQVLLALIEGRTPTVQEVKTMVDAWFENDDKVCGEHLAQMKSASSDCVRFVNDG